MACGCHFHTNALILHCKCYSTSRHSHGHTSIIKKHESHLNALIKYLMQYFSMYLYINFKDRLDANANSDSCVVFSRASRGLLEIQTSWWRWLWSASTAARETTSSASVMTSWSVCRRGASGQTNAHTIIHEKQVWSYIFCSSNACADLHLGYLNCDVRMLKQFMTVLSTISLFSSLLALFRLINKRSHNLCFSPWEPIFSSSSLFVQLALQGAIG